MSTREWIPSESMAELPVISAAVNLVTAIRLFPTRAAQMTFFEAEDILNPVKTVVMFPSLAIWEDVCLNSAQFLYNIF